MESILILLDIECFKMNGKILQMLKIKKARKHENTNQELGNRPIIKNLSHCNQKNNKDIYDKSS